MRKIRLFALTKLTAVFVIISAATPVAGQSPVANFTAAQVAGCSPLIVNFQDLSTGNPTSWSWDFGNGNTSSLQNPVASYFTPGSYTIKLTVTNLNGTNTLTRTQYITVYELPTVNFSASTVSGCFPLFVQFTDLSTAGLGNTNVSWQWDFGNGNTSTLQNPSITYTATGLYSVTLKIINDKGCTKTLTKPNFINVTPGVDASFTHTVAVVCRPPANISFTNTSSGPGVLSYLWNFGDGNTSTANNPVHTYAASGSYTVSLVTTSSGGCIDTFQAAAPVIIGGINTTFNAPDSVCANSVASFTNTSSPAPGSSFWKFGDGNTSNSINSSNIYITPGIYTVTLYNNYANCNDSATKTIKVNPLPVANFSSPDTTKCQPPLVSNFQDLSTGAVSWSWDFGDGGTSTLQNPSHTYNAYGNFTVTLVVTNSVGCTATIVKPNYVRIKRAVIAIPSLPVNGCVPFTINPIANINALDNVTSWFWKFGDGTTSVLPAPSHTYNVQGTYNVTLIITTSSGCTDSLVINSAVRVGTHPVADFSVSPNPQCSLQPVQFTDLSVPADQWSWNFGDGASSGTQNPIHTYAMPGAYDITLIATNNGCPDTITRTGFLNILPPVAKFIFSPNCSIRTQFQFTDQSTGPLSWFWDFGDATTSLSQNPLHNFPSLGVYTVKLTVTNGGCSNTDSLVVHVLDINPDFNASQTVACKPAVISFTATNINVPDINNFHWDFGDGQQANTAVPNIAHTYTISGTFTASLVTTDLNGCLDTVSKTNYIRINGPVAAFNATNIAGCAGLTTTFNDISTTDGINAIISWKWDFGDGTIQTFPAPPFQHTYNIPGIYSVKMKITDASGCTDSITIGALVAATDPVPNFNSTDTLSCPGATVNFNDLSSGINHTCFWDFGDGNTSNALAGSHSYAATGLYTVKLRIQDQYGCADSITRNLYVRVDKPLAAFTVSDSVSSCIPLDVQFTNTSTYYVSQVWDFGPGGSSTLTNPSHFFTTPGIQNVKLIVTSPGGCKDSTIKTITLYDTAGNNISYLPLAGCKPLSASFNAFSNGPMNNYIWDFGDGTSLVTTVPNATHIYNTFGNFLPKVILQDPGGCFIPITGIDTVRVIGVFAKFGLNNNKFCDQGTVVFSDSTTYNDPLLSFSWLFGDGGISNQQNPTHNYAAPGNYNVQLAVQTQTGCRDTLIKTNAVKVVQRPLIDIGGDSVICVNSSLLHLGNFIIPDTSVVTWSWTFPNGNVSALQNPAAQIYTAVGNFVVTAIASNSSGCRDTTTQNIKVNPLPTVNMPGQMTVQNGFPVTIPAVYSPNVNTWLWSPATGLSCTDCPTPDAGPKFKTLYRVAFTDNNGCQNFGFIEVMVICKNINLFIPNTFSPNGDGSNDVFYPRGVGIDRVKTLRIFNRWGEVVFEKKDFPINDPLAGWNGTYNGKKPQADVYVYQAEVFCENGEIIVLNGNISLIL